jgi:predicted amidophosphoribosyltransferase
MRALRFPAALNPRGTPVSALEPAMRSLDFASCYVYAPCGACAVSARSRSLCALIKAAAPPLVPIYARCVMRQAHLMPVLAEFFRAIDVLIPIPASEPSRSNRDYLPDRLAAAFVAEGLASSAWMGLLRVRAVAKSGTAAPGRRPTVLAHYDSMSVVPGSDLPGDARLLLIDDVVTKGRTLLAAAMRLHEAFPQAHITAFALLRTLGFKDHLEGLLEPCVGRIGWRAGDAHRNP